MWCAVALQVGSSVSQLPQHADFYLGVFLSRAARPGSEQQETEEMNLAWGWADKAPRGSPRTAPAERWPPASPSPPNLRTWPQLLGALGWGQFPPSEYLGDNLLIVYFGLWRFFLTCVMDLQIYIVFTSLSSSLRK